jgi:transcriptional regulator of arginine metabolism
MHHARDFMQWTGAMLPESLDNTSAPARRTLLAKIIRERSVGRQAELVALLRQLGFEATQSSVSRDLRELGVAKIGDRYILPDGLAENGLADNAGTPKNHFSALRQFVHERTTAGVHLTVLKTRIGSAQSVAVAIDAARWPEVVGTISGDDTIFIATAGAREQSQLGERLRDIFGI